MAEESARQSVRATGQYAASQVQSDLQATFKSLAALATSLQVARDATNPPPRPQLDATLKRLLEQHSPWLAAYSLWEPNALDGQDAEHVSKGPQDDATGRFVSYWNRGSGDIKVEPLVDYEKAGGKYVSHPDAQKIGADASDLSPEALQAVRQGQPYEYTDSTGNVRVLTPVRPDADAQPWALCIQYTEAVAQAPARAMMALVAGIVVLCAVLDVGALLTVVTRLTRPVRELATTMDALAGGQSNLRV